MIPLLETRAIRKEYPGVVALDGVDFDVAPGEVHCLLGENGAGKSTLVNILAGAIGADAGDILVDGEPVRIASPIAAQALGIGIIYQEIRLVPELDAAANIMLGHEPRSASGWAIDARALRARAAESLAGLGVTLPLDRPVRLLSPAQRQFVEIGKALSREMRVLILDEPSVALTGAELGKLFEAVRTLKARGVGVVYISHRLQEIFEIGDRITVLRDGRKIATTGVSGTTEGELIRMMVGRELRGEYARTRAERAERAARDATGRSPAGEPGAPPPSSSRPADRPPLLRLDNLCGGIVRNVSLDLEAGEVLGLAGLAGAGRTELARLVFGADPVESGRILLDGARLDHRTPRGAIDAGIGYLSEDRNGEGLVLSMTVRENMTLAGDRGRRPGFFIDRNREREQCAGYLRRLAIRAPGLDRSVGELSGGNRQKVVLARWLLANCRVLIFDEPTAGIDVGVKFEIYALIDELAAGGMGIVVISSELPELLGLSDRVAVMADGRISGVLDRAEATQERVMELAVRGHASIASLDPEGEGTTGSDDDA